MTTILSILFFVLAPLLVVCILLDRTFIETRRQKIRRLSREGVSQRAIAARVGITRYRVRLALA